MINTNENILGYLPEEILIIDDNQEEASALQEVLKRDGYLVNVAYSGNAALDIMKKTPLAIILCNQQINEMNGVDLLQKSQQLQPEAIRILLSGKEDSEAIIDAVNIGQISHFIMKPWENTLLRQAIAESVEKYRLKKENQNLHELVVNQNRELIQAHEQLRNELQLGARIHEALLIGKTPPQLPGMTITAFTLPSKEVDGDFFEFYHPAENLVDVVLGDVMGKGIPAALVGTAVKTQLMRFAVPFFRSQISVGHNFWQDDLLSPQEIISHVHQEVTSQLIQLEYFVSLFYARFNLHKKVFSYVDCGSTKPFHYKASKKELVKLKGINHALGMTQKATYQLQEESFQENDLFIFYSDGITEARSLNNELFGEERLINILTQHIHEDIHHLQSLIKQAITSFIQKDDFDDDLTLIIIKTNPHNITYASNQKTKRFYSDLAQLKNVRHFVNECCQQAAGDTERLVSQLQLAINEAFCNIVKHSYQSAPGQLILIQFDILKDGILFQLSDKGNIFNPYQIPSPDFNGERENGFGWFIIKAIADQLIYVRKEAETGWNHLRIFKRFILEEGSMNIQHTIDNDILIITPENNSLDAKDTPFFKEKVIDLITTTDKNQVVFDLSHLNFIDSSGLGSFLSVLRLLNNRGGELKLAQMSKPIRTMFELVSMNKIFETFNSNEEAISSFAAK